MITFLVTLAVLVAIGVVFAKGHGPAGSTAIVDRDAQRAHSDLAALYGRTSNV